MTAETRSPAVPPTAAATPAVPVRPAPPRVDAPEVDPASGFDPADPGFLADPQPAYDRLRAQGPVLLDPATGQLVLTRHADVTALLRDRRLGRSYLHLGTHAEFGQPGDAPGSEDFWRVVRNGMLDVEPPDHTRLRRLVSRAFTPRTVEALRPRVEAVADRLVDDLLDATAGGSAADLLELVAEPLPVTVIAELLAIPGADRHLLRPWSADMCAMYEPDPSPAVVGAASRAAREFGDYLAALAAERRSPRYDGADDLLSALARVSDPDDPGSALTTDELVGTAVLLLNAGHEATASGTGNSWNALLRHPGQLAALRADPSGVPLAVEELLRYDTPLQMFERWVLDDVELHGVRVPRGSEVALVFGAANHDPAVFADPHRLDLTRAANPHVSFGLGLHFCLGAVLARVELAASTAALLTRVPTLALADPDAAPDRRPAWVMRGLGSLRVTR